MKPYYIVSEGVNSRHLTEVHVFDFKRDAISFINDLAISRAYVLERHVSESQWAPVVRTELDARII